MNCYLLFLDVVKTLNDGFSQSLFHFLSFLFLLHRWATQGFDFLQAIEPAFISALPEDDFLVWIRFSTGVCL